MTHVIPVRIRPMQNSAVAHSDKRVKFKCHWIKSPAKPIFNEWMALAKTLELMKHLGCCPTEEGGQVCGNIAIRSGGGLIVSRSQRRDGHYCSEDFVKVLRFDFKKWEAHCQSDAPDIEPTSDTPLHWAALLEAPKKMKWLEKPMVSLHGHALSTMREAKALRLPISDKKTDFGTPNDCRALMTLFKQYRYPENRIYIRRGHGFILLAGDMADAVNELKKVIVKPKQRGRT